VQAFQEDQAMQDIIQQTTISNEAKDVWRLDEEESSDQTKQNWKQNCSDLIEAETKMQIRFFSLKSNKITPNSRRSPPSLPHLIGNKKIVLGTLLV
jgi:hypothetical protein